MGKNSNPVRTNRTRTQVLTRTKPNPNQKVKNVQEPELNRILPHKEQNRTEPKPKCPGSYSVLSLNEIVGTFTHFTVNEEFYFI